MGQSGASKATSVFCALHLGTKRRVLLTRSQPMVIVARMVGAPVLKASLFVACAVSWQTHHIRLVCAKPCNWKAQQMWLCDVVIGGSGEYERMGAKDCK